MALNAQTRLGPYEILAQIGAGGMGEVYRARDTRLERTVAIKILPCELSSNSSLKQRFEREAKTISNLSHPHICTLHDVGHEDGIDYLVMEYLEGQTLAERLTKGPLPIEEVLQHALQICEALDKAHRQGVVHRDLKPGNIMLTRHGVKLLDFGLAKLCGSAQSQIKNQKSQIDEDAPTLADSRAPKSDLTEQGTILGTVQYMAPEQLEGKEADARTDIFAFGAVLYEMASGKKAFTGKSRASLMAAILEREPERLSQIAPLIPPALDRVVSGCLAKDADERWQTAHDLKLQLKWIVEVGSETGMPKIVSQQSKRREGVAWVAAAVMTIAAACVAIIAWKPSSIEFSVTRFEVQPPIASSRVHSIALSPDGRKLAMVTREIGPKHRLWIRSLHSISAEPVPQSEGATFPFWSPDGTALGFFANGSLKKLDLNTGAIVTLCSAPVGMGGTWSATGTIIFAPEPRAPLHRVQAAGGVSTPLWEPGSHSLKVQAWPWFLSDGEHFLFWGRADMMDEADGGIYLGSLNSPKPTRQLVSSGGNGIYADGHLIFLASGGALMAVQFDRDTQMVTGDPFPIAENVESSFWAGTGVFSVSRRGAMAYLPGSRGWGTQLTWYDLEGTKLRSLGSPGNYGSVNLSPDGKSVTVDVSDQELGTSDIRVLECDRPVSMRLTTHPRSERHGIWSPDGKSIAFCSNRDGAFDLYLKDIDSVEPEKLLFGSAEDKYARSWSPDGKHMLIESFHPDSNSDIWILPIRSEPTKPQPFLNSEFAERRARFSPDGKWVAYQSNEEKRPEVFIISFPERRGKTKISSAGGSNPRWAPDGKRVYYLDGENYIASVDLELETSRIRGLTPKRLFQIPLARPASDRDLLQGLPGPSLAPPFDVVPNGKELLINTAIESTNSVPLVVVLNWPVEFQKK